MIAAAIGVVLIIGLTLLWAIGRAGKPKKARRSKRGQPGLSAAQFQAQWQRIDELMRQPGTESTKSAIFEADKLLDIALRQSGFRGETMGERLISARGSIQETVYQGMWEAHKMRNALAHELSFELPKVVAEEQLAKFKAGLQYLRVL